MKKILPLILLIAASPAFSIPHDALLPRPLVKSEGEGGDGGIEFDDMKEFNSSNIIGIHSINISSGFLVDSIEVVYVLSNKSLLRVPSRGKPSKNPVSIVLKQEEQIVKIEGKVDGEMVGQLTITTVGPNYEQKIYGPFGKKGTLSFTFKGQIIAFHGRSGDSLDSIGVYSLAKLTRSDQYGGDSSNEFDDFSDLNYPPIVAIKNISIWSRLEMVLAIQVEYLLLDGSTLLGGRHGFIYTTNLTTITLRDGEELVALQGKIETSLLTLEKYIGQLTLTIMARNGEAKTYGPFGTWGSELFNIRGNILGIHGSSGSLIYRIGAYYM